MLLEFLTFAAIVVGIGLLLGTAAFVIIVDGL